MATAVTSPDTDSSLSVSLADKLRLAASKGLLDKVTELLQSGATFEPDREGRTAIHYAAVHGYTDICKLLIDSGCDVDSKDNLGYTCLHRAAAQGHVETVKLIVDEGCAIDRQDEHGNTALHEAAWNGFSNTIKLLIKSKSNVFVTNKAGFTALHLAAQNGHNESARILLYSGCSPDMKNNYGDTAMHTAARYGHAGVIRILISAQCSVSEQNKNGDTALHIAAALKRRKISKILMEAGIDATIKNKQNEAAVDVARRKEHPEVIIIITKTPQKPIKRHHMTSGDRTKRPVTMGEAPGPSKEAGKEKKGFFPWMKKKDKEKKLFSPDTSPQPGLSPDRPRRGKHGQQGLFTQYIKKQGSQYYRDLAGNIRQGPVGFAPVCQCQPALQKLEQRVEADRHNFYDHVDATQQQLTQRIDHLERRTTQQVYSIDKLNQERLEAEKHDCHERIERKTLQERLETDRQLELVQTQVNTELRKWMDTSGRKKAEGRREETFGATPSHLNRDVFENNSFRRKKGNRRFAWAGRLIRSRSDETLSHSEYSFHGKAYQSRKNAIDQLRALKLSTVNESGHKTDQTPILRPNPVGQLTRPRTMHEGLGRRNFHEPLKALSEQSADSKSTPDMSGNFSQRRNPIDVRLLREFEDSELESRAKPHDSSNVIKKDDVHVTPKVGLSFRQLEVRPTFTSTPNFTNDTSPAANRAQSLPPHNFSRPPAYGYNNTVQKPPYSYAWSSVKRSPATLTHSNSSSNYAELSGLQSPASYEGSSGPRSPADSPGQKTESGSNPDSGYSSKIYGGGPGFPPPVRHAQSPLLVDSSHNSSANESANISSFHSSPDISFELARLHSSVDSPASRGSGNYANVSSEPLQARNHLDYANVPSDSIRGPRVSRGDYTNISGNNVRGRVFPDYANVSDDSNKARGVGDYANVSTDSSKGRSVGDYANVSGDSFVARASGDYANVSGEPLSSSRQYSHPEQEIRQWYQRHGQDSNRQRRFREVAHPPNRNVTSTDV